MGILQTWIGKPGILGLQGLVILGWCAWLSYLWLDRNNQLAQARLQIPPLQEALVEARREEGRLLFQIDAFEQPLRLQRLLAQPGYQHLHYPYLHEVIFLTQDRRVEHQQKSAQSLSRESGL
jgi:hypothetical protein